MTPAGRTGSGGRPKAEREALISALIELAAETGYRQTSVSSVVALAGVDRAAFERHFADLEDCFLAAWGELNECFTRALVRAFSEQPAWRDGVRAAAGAAMRLLQDHPRESRILFVEVQVAGEQARARRDLNMRALASLLDSARYELDDPTRVWRSTAEGIIGGIYTTVSGRLRRDADHELPALVPEMMCVAVTPYLGIEAGLEELRLAG